MKLGNKVIRCLFVLAVYGCGVEINETTLVERRQAPLMGGSNEYRPGSAAVVLLTGGCSGVLLSVDTIVTSEHCLSDPFSDENIGTAVLDLPVTTHVQVKAGAEAEGCLTPVGSACGSWIFRIARKPSSDVVLLQSDRPLAGLDGATLPVLALTGYDIGFAHGFGVFDAELSAGTRLSAEMAILQHDTDYLYGRAADGIRVCGGDSGGPLYAEAGSEGSPALLLGVLSASEYDGAEPACTKDGGLNRWGVLTSDFVLAYLDGCVASQNALDCRSARARMNPLPVENLGGTRVTKKSLINAGFRVFPEGSKSPEEVERDGLIGVATIEGDFLVQMPTKTQGEQDPVVTSLSDGGEEGLMVPLSNRALALNGNGDQRVGQSIVQIGIVRSTNSTSPTAGGCTGTLIGRRLVRTAEHCLNNLPRPYFTARFDGGPTTWTFDGGQTWVTFNPRRADGHFYGGNFYNYGCAISQGDPQTPRCYAQDWAVLIMAQNVWQPVHVIPAYMGFDTASATSGASVGYPADCGDVSTPGVTCRAGRQYGMNCSNVVNHTSYFYSNCDVSPGHSGAPFYKTVSGSRYLIGSHKGGPTNVGCSNGTCQAAYCGTDSWLFDFQSSLRSQYNQVTL
jgi:V8-like Glu-specific endopeptidase